MSSYEISDFTQLPHNHEILPKVGVPEVSMANWVPGDRPPQGPEGAAEQPLQPAFDPEPALGRESALTLPIPAEAVTEDTEEPPEVQANEAETAVTGLRGWLARKSLSLAERRATRLTKLDNGLQGSTYLSEEANDGFLRSLPKAHQNTADSVTEPKPAWATSLGKTRVERHIERRRIRGLRNSRKQKDLNEIAEASTRAVFGQREFKGIDRKVEQHDRKMARDELRLMMNQLRYALPAHKARMLVEDLRPILGINLQVPSEVIENEEVIQPTPVTPEQPPTPTDILEQRLFHQPYIDYEALESLTEEEREELRKSDVGLILTGLYAPASLINNSTDKELERLYMTAELRRRQYYVTEEEHQERERIESEHRRSRSRIGPRNADERRYL